MTPEAQEAPIAPMTSSDVDVDDNIQIAPAKSVEDAEATVDYSLAEDGETEDEEDDDSGDPDTSFTTMKRQVDTPPTAQTTGVIGETPGASKLDAGDERMSDAADTDADSPLTKKTRESQERGNKQVKAGLLADKFDDDDDDDDDDDGNIFAKHISPRKPKQTYIGRSRSSLLHDALVGGTKSTPAAPSEAGDVQDHVDEGDQEVEEQAAPTSTLDEHGVAHETARRSIGGLKRKPVTSPDEDDEEKPKKRKKRTELELLSGANEVGSTKQAPKPQRSGKKTAEAAKTVASSDAASENEIEEEIVVAMPEKSKAKGQKKARAASPQVVIPSSSIRSTPARSTPGDGLEAKKMPKVLFSASSQANNKKVDAFLKKHGSGIIPEPETTRANFICVTRVGQLPTTSRILRSLALGKLVVSEEWITASQAAGKLLDPSDFVHKQVRSTLHVDRGALFQGYKIYFTKTLAKEYGNEWENVQALAREAGASFIDKGNADNGHNTAALGNVIYLGSAGVDADVIQLIEMNHTVYHKDLLSNAVLEGNLELDDDDLKLGGSGGGAKQRKSKRR